MQETAHILHHATHKSLILLDEIGRGTATFDGLSSGMGGGGVHRYRISGSGPKTVFATHYHELTDLASELSGVVNYHVSAKEWKDDIVFLRKVVPGGSDRSYGIQVARLAGLPRPLIGRAQEILTNLERTEFDSEGRPRLVRRGGRSCRRRASDSYHCLPRPKLASPPSLRKLDPDQMTPLEALQALSDLKKKLDE